MRRLHRDSMNWLSWAICVGGFVFNVLGEVEYERQKALG